MRILKSPGSLAEAEGLNAEKSKVNISYVTGCKGSYLMAADGGLD